jgi:hypothetical protein
MQFIPSTWQVWGRDGDGDGRADPSDIDDAALATASYLCAADRDLRNEKDRRSAVFSYNHSWDYVDLVLAWADAYATGVPLTTDLLPAADGRQRPSGGERAGEGPSAVLALPAPGPTQQPATGGDTSGSAGGAGSTAPPSAAPAEGPQPTDATTSAASSPTTTTTAAPSDPPTGPDPCATPSPTDTPTGDPTDTATPSPTPTDSVTPEPTPTDSSPSPTPTDCPTTTTPGS